MPIDITQLDEVQARFIKRIQSLLPNNLGDVNLAQLDAQIDFFQELNASGYSDTLEDFFKEYDDVIKQVHLQATSRGLSGIVGVSATDLDLLANNEALFLLDKGKLYTQQFKNSIVRSIIGGETIGEILPSLKGIPLTDAQLTTGISTGIEKFHATATAKVFEESPNQKFRLEGAIDGKTRASCRAVFENQPKEGLTKSEIDAGAWTKLAKQFMVKPTDSERKVIDIQGYTFIERGGFNCRQQPQPGELEL